jgi:hypothetical protein
MAAGRRPAEWANKAQKGEATQKNEKKKKTKAATPRKKRKGQQESMRSIDYKQEKN